MTTVEELMKNNVTCELRVLAKEWGVKYIMNKRKIQLASEIVYRMNGIIEPPKVREKNARKIVKCPHGKYKYFCKECDGRYLCCHDKQKYFRDVESFGMKKFETEGGSNYFSFSLKLKEEALEKLEKVIQACEDLAKMRKSLKKLSFEKFSPIRGNILYCRVQYNPKAKRLYTKFFKGFEKIDPSVLLEEECLMDAAVMLDSVFCNEEECFLYLNLAEVRYKKSIAIKSFLDDSSQDEEESDEEEPLAECIQRDYKTMEGKLAKEPPSSSSNDDSDGC